MKNSHISKKHYSDWKKYIQKMIIIYHLNTKKKNIILTDRKRISISIKNTIKINNKKLELIIFSNRIFR